MPIGGSQGRNGAIGMGPARAVRSQNRSAKTYISKLPASAKQVAARQAASKRMAKTYSKAKNSNAKAGASGAGGALVGFFAAGNKKKSPKSVPPTGRGASLAAVAKSYTVYKNRGKR